MQITCTSAIRTVKKHIWKLILPQIFHSACWYSAIFSKFFGHYLQKIWTLFISTFTATTVGKVSIICQMDFLLTGLPPSTTVPFYILLSRSTIVVFLKARFYLFFCSKSSNDPYPTPWKTKVIVTVCYLFSHLNFSLYNHCCNQTDSWTIS